MVSAAPNSVRAGNGGNAGSAGGDRVGDDGMGNDPVVNDALAKPPFAKVLLAKYSGDGPQRPLWLLLVLLALVIPVSQVGQWFDGLWLPTFGLGFSILVLYGMRWLPALYLVDLVGAVAWSKSMTASQFAHTAEFIAALAVGYGLAAWVIRLCRVDISLRRLRDAVIFSTAGAAGAALGALAAMTVLLPQIAISDHVFWKSVEYFGVGGAAGTFAVAPIVLVSVARYERGGLASFRAAGPRKWTLRTWVHAAEVVAQVGVFAAAAALAVQNTAHAPVYYPLLIPVFWVALRRGIAGTAAGVAIGTCVVSIVANANGLRASQVSPLETFLTVFAITGLCFGAAQTERQDALRELDRLATTDHLTGLANKRHMLRTAGEAVARAGRSGHRIGAIFIDLDDFKRFNDEWADHTVGDEVLAMVSLRIEACVRPGDIASRYGGDEFVVICTDLERPDELDAIARRIETAVATPIELGGKQYSIDASFGVEIGRLGENPIDLIKRADANMYADKEDRRIGRTKLDLSDSAVALSAENADNNDRSDTAA